MQTVEDVIQDPQARANGAFVSVAHLSDQEIELVATPIDFGATPAETRHAAPESSFTDQSVEQLANAATTRGNGLRSESQ